jgi:hypothetical protein
VVVSSQGDLSWKDQSSNEDGFEIERKTGTGSYALIARVLPNTAVYTDGTTESGKSYTYRVRAYNAGGGAYSNEASVTTNSHTAPAAPASLAAKVVALTQVDLTWADQASNEDGFEIQRKTGTGAYVMIARVATNVVSFSDTSVQKDQSYTYRVRAHNTAGESFSNETTVTVTCQTKGNGGRCK